MKYVDTGGTRDVKLVTKARGMTVSVQAPGYVRTVAKHIWEIMLSGNR